MSATSAANANAANAVPPASPPRRKRLVLIALAAVLLLAAGGAGAWFLLARGAHAATGHVEAPPPKPRKPVFAVLDPFTVNLRDEQGERFAQIGITLDVDSPDVEAQVKERLPAVRNAVLLLLSSKRIEELLTPEGKQALAEEVGQRVSAVIAPPSTSHGSGEAAAAEPPVRAVLFSQFIVQ